MAGELHRYLATCSWRGSTGVGYEHYSREHRVEIGEQRLPLSSDPAFRGDPKLLNPEQLLLAAAVSCQLLSFLAIAARARLEVVRYDDQAEAEMPQRAKAMRIERIVLRPHIVLRIEPGADVSGAEAKVRKLVAQAHRECFIANTLSCELVIEPRIEFVA